MSTYVVNSVLVSVIVYFCKCYTLSNGASPSPFVKLFLPTARKASKPLPLPSY